MQEEPLFTAFMNVNLNGYYGNQLGGLFRKLVTDHMA